MQNDPNSDPLLMPDTWDKLVHLADAWEAGGIEGLRKAYYEMYPEKKVGSGETD